MKITDSTPPPSGDSRAKDAPADPRQNADPDKPSPFSKLLSKKRDPLADGVLDKSGKPGGGMFDAVAAGLVAPNAPPKAPVEPSIKGPQTIESKQVVALPSELHQLVREISVVTDSSGKQQVNIEMNSSVLKGLHIRIERQEGAVAIQFQSASDNISQLLKTNVEALTQGLADRGVNVAEIRVSGPADSSSSSSDSKYRPGSGGRQQQGGGQQQGGRR